VAELDGVRVGQAEAAVEQWPGGAVLSSCGTGVGGVAAKRLGFVVRQNEVAENETGERDVEFWETLDYAKDEPPIPPDIAFAVVASRAARHVRR